MQWLSQLAVIDRARRSLPVAACVALLVGACFQGEQAAAQGKLGPACGKGDAWLPGSYTLTGVPEVGSQLLLREDGAFEFYLAYGANDQSGSGCWTQHGRNIALFPYGQMRIAGDHTPATRGFSGILLQIEGRDLIWEIPNSRYRGRYTR